MKYFLIVLLAANLIVDNQLKRILFRIGINFVSLPPVNASFNKLDKLNHYETNRKYCRRKCRTIYQKAFFEFEQQGQNG